MYGLSTLISANHLAGAARFEFAGAGASYPPRLLRSTRRCTVAAAGIDNFAISDKNNNSERKMLPWELARSVVRLECESFADGGVCDVYLVGTLHRTQNSCEEVKALIEFVKPEVVFLELCHSRASVLQDASGGGEFYVANKEAIKHGAMVVLGDRPNNITWARFPIMMFFRELLVSPIRFMEFSIKLDERDELGASNLTLDEIEDEIHRRIFPSHYENIVSERDQYMSAKLLEAARQCNSVVAVVGEGHLRGIQKYWEQPVDMRQLLHTPTRRRIVLYIRQYMMHKVVKPLLDARLRFVVKQFPTTTTARIDNYERKMLLSGLLRDVVTLKCESSANGGICDVYLVGTKTYAESQQEVQSMVQFLKPQVVFLEICSSREHHLTGQKVKVPTIIEMVDMLKKKQNPFWRLYMCFLSRIEPQLEANNDFRVAYEEAIRHGHKVILGDRPREITFLRYVAKIPLGELFSQINEHVPPRFLIDMQKKMVTAKDDTERAKLLVQYKNEMLPISTEAFIHERDRYMSAKLLEVAREHNTVFAVVDTVHLPGIQNHWKEPIDMKQLHGVPMAKAAIAMGVINTLLFFVILRWFGRWFKKN